jgi:hypothetical protein
VQIWVDADACPNGVKEILFRAADRHRVTLTLVANQRLRTPLSPYVQLLRVGPGFDVADRAIAARLSPGDLVVTADIPLAAAVIERGGHALDPRGELYSRDNIAEILAMRNFMDGLRGSGIDTGGPAAFSQSDRHAFANQLDRFIQRHLPASAPDP